MIKKRFLYKRSPALPDFFVSGRFHAKAQRRETKDAKVSRGERGGAARRRILDD